MKRSYAGAGRSGPKKIVLPVKSRTFRPIASAATSRPESYSSDDCVDNESEYHQTPQYRRLAVEGGPLELGRQLRNLLKLPKAYKWCVYEWFYSSIDRVLLKGENDFQICLRDSFPDLHTRSLCRFQWRKIRKLLGKPRRCSQAFLYEERRALQKKRAKIRWLQLKRPADPVNFRDIPNSIPKALNLNDLVTAYLYQSAEVQSGLYTGSIEAIDIATNLYRISFPRLGIGSFWISDAEVWCPEKYQLFPLETFMDAKRQITLNKSATLNLMLQNQNSTLSMTETEANPGKVIESGAVFGGFPIKFLAILVHLTKLLGRKKYLIDKLNCENTRAEEIVARSCSFSLEFKENYANILLELESINQDLCAQFESASHFARGMSPNGDGTVCCEVKSRCEENASNIVHKLTSENSRLTAENPGLTSENSGLTSQNSRLTSQNPGLTSQNWITPHSETLVTKLTTVLLQLKALSEGELRAFETRGIKETLDEMKSMIDPVNHNLFQRDVEVNVNHIQTSLNLYNSLQLFSS